MAGKGEGEGEGNIVKLENQITVMKYSLIFTNIVIWIIAAAVFALCLWLRFEPGLEEWIKKLELEKIYIGLYILLIAAIIMMIVAFIGCVSALQESNFVLLLYIGTQVLSFLLANIGSAVLLEYSTRNSHIQPLIRESMRRLIMNAHHEESRQTLAIVQENIGCCGADGPGDYLQLQQPLPSQCRDTVTGNPFFFGCVDELTWFFEEKVAWVTGLALTVCFFHVINSVLSVILMQALRKERNIDEYRH